MKSICILFLFLWSLFSSATYCCVNAQATLDDLVYALQDISYVLQDISFELYWTHFDLEHRLPDGIGNLAGISNILSRADDGNALRVRGLGTQDVSVVSWGDLGVTVASGLADQTLNVTGRVDVGDTPVGELDDEEPATPTEYFEPLVSEQASNNAAINRQMAIDFEKTEQHADNWNLETSQQSNSTPMVLKDSYDKFRSFITQLQWEPSGTGSLPFTSAVVLPAGLGVEAQSFSVDYDTMKNAPGVGLFRSVVLPIIYAVAALFTCVKIILGLWQVKADSGGE